MALAEQRSPVALVARVTRTEGTVSLQLNAGVVGFKLPIGLGVVLVAVVLPCVDFVGEDLLVGDAAIQTLRRERAEFGLGHVEPTAVLGRVVPLEALDEPGVPS
jgi:hypothetical protein